MLLGELIEQLTVDVRLKAPSLTTAEHSLYMRKPKVLEQATRPNLEKSLSVSQKPTRAGPVDAKD
jgi:ubiquitin-activating enzyme E1 C